MIIRSTFRGSRLGGQVYIRSAESFPSRTWRQPRPWACNCKRRRVVASLILILDAGQCLSPVSVLARRAISPRPRPGPHPHFRTSILDLTPSGFASILDLTPSGFDPVGLLNSMPPGASFYTAYRVEK